MSEHMVDMNVGCQNETKTAVPQNKEQVPKHIYMQNLWRLQSVGVLKGNIWGLN